MIAIKLKKKALSLLLVILMLLAPSALLPTGLMSHAAGFGDLNQPNVFLKQCTPVTCTLSSAAMMLRRTAIAAGDSDWEEITEENIRSVAWVDGLGLLWNFTAYNMTVGHGYFSGENTRLDLLDLLDSYPQGVLIYNGGNNGQSHAVILTDYDEVTDTFYVADPSSAAPEGRIKLEDSTIVGETQNEQINNLTSYWYVASPLVQVDDGDYTTTDTPTDPDYNGEQGTYEPQSDTAVFRATQKAVGAYYVVTDDSASGSALRYYPSGSSSEQSRVSKGTLLYMDFVGQNNFGAQWYMTASGYYIFSGNVTSLEEYSKEITKYKNTAKTTLGTYSVSSSSDTKTPLRLEPSEGNNIIAYAENGTHLLIKSSGVNTVGASWYRTLEGYYVKASELIWLSDSQLADSAFTGEILRLSGVYESSPIPDDSSALGTNAALYRITASVLNLRKSPVDGEVLTGIPKDTQIVVTEVQNGWGFVSYRGCDGWISLAYAEKISTGGETPVFSAALSAVSVQTGGSVLCQASAGEESYLYRFSVFDDSGTCVYQNTSFSSANTAAFRTDVPGVYYFRVEASDDQGRITVAYSADFTVYCKLQLSSVISNVDDYAMTYEPITWTAQAVSVSDSAVYCYSLYRDGVLIAEEESLHCEYTYVPEEPGDYCLTVSLSDSDSRSEPVQSAVTTVYAALCIDAITLSSTGIVCGESVTCTLAASGGTGEYQYCFSLFRDGKIFRSGVYGKGDSATFCLTSTGTYAVFCSVTDSANRVVSAFSSNIVVIDSMLGDVNGDGRITSVDARMVLRYTAGLDKIADAYLAAADVNKDGKVNAADARIILRCSANIEFL